jgi:molecular chaperone DnaK (HSP70)
MSTVYDVKRLMGVQMNDVSKTDLKQWPFKVIDEGGKPKIEITLDGEKKHFFP